MDIQQILTADYLDILFDNRNKSYGGYQLRRQYAQRTLKALSTVLLSIGLLAAYPVIANAFKPKLPVEDIYSGHVITMAHVEPPIAPPVITPPPPAGGAPKTHFKTASFIKPVIVANNDATNLLKSVDDIKDAVISTEDHPGDPANDNAGMVIAGNGGTGIGKKGTGVAFSETKATDKPVEWVEQMPQFKGDMMKYLQDHIQYPQAAIEGNIDGKVIVRFVVSEDGSISLAQIVKGIGGGCDEEALRVVKGMPKWKPGKQNGQPVKVYFTLPIVFRYM